MRLTTDSACKTLLVPALAGALLITSASPGEAARGKDRLRDVPVAVQTITAEELAKLPTPRDLTDLTFLTPAEPVVVRGDYDQVNLRGLPNSNREPVNLPVRVGTTPDGTPVVTFNMPPMPPLGMSILTFTKAGGSPYDQPVHIYAFLNATLEREKLRSGQRARFTYDLGFGEGPGLISARITTSGPINYDKNGVVQTLQIDRDGHARLVGYITALRGSPVGIPFSITPEFDNLRLRKR